MPILIILRLEKRITQRHRLNPLHINIRHKLRINIEEHWHIDRLTRIQPLLLEAETLDLAEIRGHLTRGDRVRGDADDVFVGLVGGRVEGERGLARQDAHFALLGYELPRQDVRDGAVEGDADAWVVLDGLEALGWVDTGVAAVRGGFDGLPAPAGLLADLGSGLLVWWGRGRGEGCVGGSTILYMGTEPYVIATKPTMTLKT